MNRTRIERQQERARLAMAAEEPAPVDTARAERKAWRDELNRRWAEERREREALERIKWSKWTDDRVEIAQLAAPIWLPLEDLQEFLNRLPGPHLTEMDVYQRLRSLRSDEECYCSPPDEELRDECFSLYAAEKAKGTEFVPILKWLEDWISQATEKLEQKRREEAERQQRIEDDAKLRSGANWPTSGRSWVRAIGLPGYYCRKQGRLFRFLENDDAKNVVTEIRSLDDPAGTVIAEVRTFTEAAKAVTLALKK